MSLRQSTFVVAAFVKHCVPSVIVTVVSPPGWFAAAAVARAPDGADADGHAYAVSMPDPG